jgi:hypothetical protein
MPGKPDILDAVKIQARAVIPIVKALERELGKERAHAIVGAAIAGDYARSRGGSDASSGSKSWRTTP